MRRSVLYDRAVFGESRLLKIIIEAVLRLLCAMPNTGSQDQRDLMPATGISLGPRINSNSLKSLLFGLTARRRSAVPMIERHLGVLDDLV